MAFQVISDSGEPLDAHLDIEGCDFIFHSRGGKKGRPGARNLQYGPALRLLLARVNTQGARVIGAWIDSDEVSHLSLDSRSVLHETELTASPATQFTAMSKRMQLFGRPPGAAYGGSRVKKVRVRLDGCDEARMQMLLGVQFVPNKLSEMPLERGNAPVTAEHFWLAVDHLSEVQQPTVGRDSPFEVVIDETSRLDAAAVVSLAMAIALDRPVSRQPLDEAAHSALVGAGFNVSERGNRLRPGNPLSDEDRAWTEGRPKLVRHLKRERAPGLSMAKKAQLRRLHGKLFCERCGLDPVVSFGSEAAEACIEVHHREVQVGDMGDGSRTKLEHVECLCANCHRLVHALLRHEASARALNSK